MLQLTQKGMAAHWSFSSYYVDQFWLQLKPLLFAVSSKLNNRCNTTCLWVAPWSQRNRSETTQSYTATHNASITPGCNLPSPYIVSVYSKKMLPKLGSGLEVNAISYLRIITCNHLAIRNLTTVAICGLIGINRKIQVHVDTSQCLKSSEAEVRQQ